MTTKPISSEEDRKDLLVKILREDNKRTFLTVAEAQLLAEVLR